MLKDITLGQFFPGNSFLHKLDPRTKIISVILYITVIFLCKNIYSFIFASIMTLFLIVLSGISVKVIMKGIKPLFFILLITTVYNVFFHSGETLLFEYGIIKIYYEGIMFAILISLRIVCLIAGSGVILTYTTSPIKLTDGLESLLKPLSRLKFPVHEFSMMMTIALRFIPTLIEETDKIMNAQKSRGSDLSSGGIISRAKALIPVIIPLIISSFRRAGELATAMECRCYRGGSGRTKMTKLKMTYRDPMMLMSIVLSGVAIILMNTYLPGFVF